MSEAIIRLLSRFGNITVWHNDQRGNPTISVDISQEDTACLSRIGIQKWTVIDLAPEMISEALQGAAGVSQNKRRLNVGGRLYMAHTSIILQKGAPTIIVFKVGNQAREEVAVRLETADGALAAALQHARAMREALRVMQIMLMHSPGSDCQEYQEALRIIIADTQQHLANPGKKADDNPEMPAEAQSSIPAPAPRKLAPVRSLAPVSRQPPQTNAPKKPVQPRDNTLHTPGAQLAKLAAVLGTTTDAKSGATQTEEAATAPVTTES